MTIIIPGKPIPKKRPKFARKGKHVVAYNPQKEEVRAAQWALRSQHKGNPLEGALEVSLVFSMLIPMSETNKRKEMMCTGKILHTKKPDLDNLEKFILDCCNGLLWKDDSQIIAINSVKHYSNTPQTMITIREL
jgi:Holliday junction resolvase RusA-like endonuclease